MAIPPKGFTSIADPDLLPAPEGEVNGKRLIRHKGNDEELRSLAIEVCRRIAQGLRCT